jgi:hypothetical protein
MTSAASGGAAASPDIPGESWRLPRILDQPLSTEMTGPAGLPAQDHAQNHTQDHLQDHLQDHNPLFGMLVESETDVTGLLAYGLYKQNKRDWLIAFQAREGRDPAKAELDAFILGERIPRRTATYRRLAEDMLAKGGHSPGLLTGLMAAPANDTMRSRAAIAEAVRKPVTWRYILFLLGMLVAMAVLFRLTAGWLFAPGR